MRLQPLVRKHLAESPLSTSPTADRGRSHRDRDIHLICYEGELDDLPEPKRSDAWRPAVPVWGPG